MKKKFNLVRVYIEAIIYILTLILAISLCLTDNIYITMIPIAFITGGIGQIVFGKKIMTSFFSGIISVVLLQMENPALIWNNLLESLKIIILVLIGELFGWAVKRVYRISYKKKKISKKVKNERLNCGMIAIISLVIGMILSGKFNGDYITFFKARNSLKSYFIQEYYSSSRFKITSCIYNNSLTNPIYTFYTQDSLSNNVSGRFSVYIKDKYNVQDDYQEQVKKSISDKINSEINKVYENGKIQVFVSNSELNNLTICLKKQVDNINKEEIEKYSKEIAECLDVISVIDEFDEIEQIKLVLESRNNLKESLASYIFMSGYNEVIKNNSKEAYLYIMKALNIEYFD